MTRLALSTRIGADGVLHVPIGQAEAHREVRVTIEPTGLLPEQARQDYLDFLHATAGAWQGDFERPPHDPFEDRDPLE